MNFTKIDGRGQRKTSERRVLPRTREAGCAIRIQVIAWQNVLLTGLRPVFGTTPPSTTTSVPSRRGETVIYRSFGTATLPTGTSVASPRGETVLYRTFGTETLPTDASMGSSRCHCELVHRIVALLGFVKFTWNEPLLIIK